MVRGHRGQEDTRNTKVQGRPEVRGHRRSRDTGIRGHRKSEETVGKIDTGGQGTPGSGCMETQAIPVNGGPERPPRGGGACAVLRLLRDTQILCVTVSPKDGVPCLHRRGEHLGPRARTRAEGVQKGEGGPAGTRPPHPRVPAPHLLKPPLGQLPLLPQPGLQQLPSSVAGLHRNRKVGVHFFLERAGRAVR